MTDSIELTRIHSLLKLHEERLIAQDYVIKTLLSLLTQPQLDRGKDIIRKSAAIHEHDRLATNDTLWLQRHAGVKRELNYIIPDLFNSTE